MKIFKIFIGISGTFRDLVSKQSGKIKIACKRFSALINFYDEVLKVLSKDSDQSNTNLR